MGQIEKWGPDYRIEFDLKLPSANPIPNSHNWYSFLRLTTKDEDCSDFGCRLPSINFPGRRYPDSQPIMVVYITQSEGQDQRHKAIYLKFDQWYNVQLDHRVLPDRSHGVFTVSVDGTVMWRQNTVGINENPAIAYKNVLWYQSNPWFPSVGDYIEIKCLRLKNIITV